MSYFSLYRGLVLLEMAGIDRQLMCAQIMDVSLYRSLAEAPTCPGSPRRTDVWEWNAWEQVEDNHRPCYWVRPC